jgi:hypothetical protein
VLVGTASALGLVAALGVAGPASAQPEGLCLGPIQLGSCDAPGGDAPGVGDIPVIGGVVDGLLGDATGGATGGLVTGVPGLVLGPDPGSTRWTLPAAQLTGSAISIEGLSSLGLVTIDTLDGRSAVVIRIAADRVVVDDFVLDVRKHAGGDAAVNHSGVLDLRGHVVVYLDSLTGTTLGGLGLTLGTDGTPPPGGELPPKLLGVYLGLVGMQSDVMYQTPTHLEVYGAGS